MGGGLFFSRLNYVYTWNKKKEKKNIEFNIKDKNKEISELKV